MTIFHIEGSLIEEIQADPQIDVEENEQSRCTIIDTALLKRPSLYLFSSVQILWVMAMFMMFGIAPDLAVENGQSKPDAAWLISIISMFSVVGALSLIPIDLFIRPPSMLLFGCIVSLNALPIAFLPLFDSYNAMISCCAVYGILSGLQNGLLPVVFGDFYGERSSTSAFGYLMLADGIGGLAAPPFSGFFYNLMGRYDTAYYLSAGGCVVAGFVFVSVYVHTANKLRWCWPPSKKNRVSPAHPHKLDEESRLENGQSQSKL